MRENQRKSQITLFLILGLVILTVFGFAFYFSKVGAEGKKEESLDKLVRDPIRVQPVKQFTSMCLDKLAKDALILLGEQGGNIYKSQGGLIEDFEESDQGKLFVRNRDFNVAHNILLPSYDEDPYSSHVPKYPWPKFPYRYGSVGERIAIDDPPGLQWQMDAAYNSKRDEYFIVYGGSGSCEGCEGIGWGARLNPRGEVLGIIPLSNPSPDNPVNNMAVAYNPDRDEYLVAIRNDEPSKINVRYLNGEGRPITVLIPIAEKGGGPSIEYSPTHKRYMVRWNWGYRQTYYRMVEGDGTTSQPLIGGTVIVAGDGSQGSAMVSQVAYGEIPDKFLYVYVGEDESRGNNQGNTFGRFITGDGSGFIEPQIQLYPDAMPVTSPKITYAPSTDNWFMTWQEFTGQEYGFDVKAALIDSDGTIFKKFWIIRNGDKGWDSPGPVTYHNITDKFYATWKYGDSAYIVGVDPSDGYIYSIIEDDMMATAPPGVMPQSGAYPQALVARTNPKTDPDDPQLLLVWRWGFGGNGVHATIASLKTGLFIEDGEGGYLPLYGTKNLNPLEKNGSRNSFQEQMEAFIENNFANCVKSGDFEKRGFDITYGDAAANVTIREDDVHFKLKIPITIRSKSAEEKTTIEDFSTQLDVRLRDLYSFVNKTIDNETQDIEFNISDNRNNRNGFNISITYDVYMHDDIINITDYNSSIDNKPYQYKFGRINRMPALFYLRNDLLKFDIGYVITRDDFLQGVPLKALDPDEDSVYFKIILNGRAVNFPIILTSSQLRFMVEVHDGGLFDYQVVTVNNRGT